MNDNRSVATISDPEFIDVHPYNPLISQCTIKVLYLGQNRNHSYIDKNTAIQMANSLPGCPIVGAYREDVEDFGDHGHVIRIEDGEIKFSCKTRPYGFVAPDARVWFQKFSDADDFGNEIEREYMMTNGYLWTGQYKEAMSVIQEGKGQSMELDEETLDGKWATDSKSGIDFFIINDAIFSKLCILGDDVEPCFEGASITEIDNDFTENADFARSLYTMMNELKTALACEGGLEMPEKEEFTESVAEGAVATEEFAAEEETTEPAVDHAAEETSDSSEEVSEEFVEKKEEDEAAPSDQEDSDSETAPTDEEEKKKQTSENACGGSKKRKYSIKEEDAMLKELEELRAFKLSIENEQKDAVINKYHMLSDEDKADVVAHKSEYSVQQIDEKLALVYVNKNVDFMTVDGHKDDSVELDESPLLSFSLDDDGNTAETISDVQAALREMTGY